MTTAVVGKKTLLECTTGGSNKSYGIWLEKEGDGFTVQFIFGPRGGHQTPGSKTKSPVPLEKAEKIMSAVVAEKLGKGYVSVGGDVPEYTKVSEKIFTGILPMLLTPATEDDMGQFIEDDKWSAQPKLNGLRLLVQVRDGVVTGINRKGQARPIPVGIEAALAKMGDGIVDGEKIGETFNVFDVLEHDGIDLRETGMKSRYVELGKLVKKYWMKDDAVQLVATEYSADRKRALAKVLKDTRREGVVFKDVAAPYEVGRTENLKKAIAVKIKYVATGTFLVLGWSGEKSSIEVAVAKGGDDVSVGRVTVPGKYAKQIKVGGLVEVRYLYATGGDQLYQPVLSPTEDGKVIRTDVICTKLSELKHEGKEEE